MAVSEVFQFIVDADARGAIREFKRASAAARAEFEKTGQGAGAAGGFAAITAGVKGAAIGIGATIGLEIGERSVDAAADFETAMLRVRQTFKGAAGEVEGFARSAAGFGLAADAAAQGTAVFGELLTQLGQTRKEAAGNSVELTKIAAGFAAMNNADPSAVIQAVAAAFRGEYDSLQRYLPAINDAYVRQRAVALGAALARSL